jgi:Tfp pilus assembly protein PilF
VVDLVGVGNSKTHFIRQRSAMRKFIAEMRSGSNHGKGLKSMKIGDHANAVHYFQKALENAENADDEAMIPYELESIANAYFMLKDFDQAEVYAKKSLKLFEQIEHLGDVVKDRIQAVRHLLDLIDTEKN